MDVGREGEIGVCTGCMGVWCVSELVLFACGLWNVVDGMLGDVVWV